MNRTIELIAALERTGYRITPQRAEICRALAENKEHPTAAAIFAQVKATFPGVSQATVYNTLTVLRDLGEVVEVGLGQDRTHYEPDPTPHANLICLRCGKIEDIEDARLADLSAELAARHDLRLKAARMDVYGLCSACQAVTTADSVSG
jgi:Fur family peroxide stress response transcriptional regulator